MSLLQGITSGCDDHSGMCFAGSCWQLWLPSLCTHGIAHKCVFRSEVPQHLCIGNPVVSTHPLQGGRIHKVDILALGRSCLFNPDLLDFSAKCISQLGHTCNKSDISEPSKRGKIKAVTDIDYYTIYINASASILLLHLWPLFILSIYSMFYIQWAVTNLVHCAILDAVQIWLLLEVIDAYKKNLSFPSSSTFQYMFIWVNNYPIYVSN